MWHPLLDPQVTQTMFLYFCELYFSHFEVYFSDFQRCISQTYILGGNSEGDVLARPQLGHHAHLPPATKYFEKSYLPIVELLIKIYINICLVVFFQEKWYFSFYPHLQGSIKSLQICLHVGLKKKYFRLGMKMNIFGKYCVPLKYSSSCQAPSLEIMRSCTIVERKRETVRAEGQRAE